MEGTDSDAADGALDAAERAVSVAAEKQHLSEMEIQQKLDGVHALRGELGSLVR